ncbi:hypothetical protein OV208_18400 [Corallococcus sp. bb12-1]|uniref:hypothetical protein n=1 Tax=Corallococcus sp. bb12-1 TaxID=2996784 RepID=UPI0022708AA1|nr:hypothetical protein [Corallococcus sp. bb12-1]MCY1043294.1 hypothetical protein [Corallococcus sp. bb12-1]
MQTQAASKSGGSRIVVMLLVMVVAMGGGIFVALKLLGSAGKSDVGDLEALASVQAQLRAVDACRIQYNHWPRSHHRQMHRLSVFITPCGASGIAPSSGKVKLPESWAHDALAFEAERSSVTDDWSILVNSEAVPFPVLLAGLSELAPIVVRDAPGALAKMRADEAEGNAKYEEGLRRREQQRQQNQDSYPSR